MDEDLPDTNQSTLMYRPASSLKTWISVALDIAKKSTAPDKQVGAVAIDGNGNILGYGYNYCIDTVDSSTVDENGVTKETTIHAEIEMIHRAMELHHSLQDAIVFITHSPCLRCAAQLKRAKVKTIYFLHTFKNGISHDFLLGNEVNLIQLYGEEFNNADDDCHEHEDFYHCHSDEIVYPDE